MVQTRFSDATAAANHNRGWDSSFDKLDDSAREDGMTTPRIVSQEEWLKARKAFLAKEKEFTRAARRAGAPATRTALGEGRKALHLRCGRGAGLSRRPVRRQGPAPDLPFHDGTGLGGGLPELLVLGRQLSTVSTCIWRIATPPWSPYRAHRWPGSRPTRSAWAGRSAGYRRPAAISTSTTTCRSSRTRRACDYNFGTIKPFGEETPGISAFRRGDDGAIYHTYSTYARGLDMLNGAYHLLDLTSKGRDEQVLPWPMAWVKRHDRY